MGHEQQLGVKFIGYSAFLVTPGATGVDKTLAIIDFVTSLVTVADDGHRAILAVRTKGQLNPFLTKLQASVVELREAVENFTSEQEANVAGFTVHTDTNGRRIIGAARNTLTLMHSCDLGVVINNLVAITSGWDEILRQIEKVGRKIKRQPYEEFISGTTKGPIAVPFYGFGVFQAGHLVYPY